ncbi:polycystic kidney disease 1 like 1 [Siniperca chuatsi]|uniref:polycystic kidney disease 1 like 1 n=1 Tax=Siniperca chuatsi TaxID=119488 RepID=UPI001CE10B65|nr:polycystic kidney disease 1 like 1 [Siniperca chuatsi]
MFRACVYTLFSLHPFFHRLSAAVPPPDHENSPWFVGCVNASDRLYAPKGALDLDPVTCCARCLDEGYQVAGLTSGGCYCGNRQHGLVASECFNTSSNAGTKDVKGESKRQSVLCLPVGDGQGSVALYRTEGPYLHSVRLSASPDRVQAGKAFVVEVSGSLAGRPNQPTGILRLGGQDLSYVTVEFQETTPKGQSSHHVKVLDDGSFVVSSDWILETPGKYELNVSVSNPLSTLSSTLHLSVLQPSPDSLVISVHHGPLGVPSCIPFLQADFNSVTVEAAYLGEPVKLQAHMGDGLPVEFIWWFTHKEKEKNMEGVKTSCLPNSDCLNSTVNWTFETEGVHMVSVNASSAYGWTQETIYVVVVRLAVSDLRVSVSGNQLTSGESVSVDVGLFTTMEHLLVLNLTLNAEYGSIGMKDNLSTDGGDFSNDNKNISDSDNVDNHSSIIAHQENSNDHDCSNSNRGNISYDHNLNQNICCHAGTHLHLCSDTHHFVPLRLLHTSNRSSCHLQLHLRCRLPTTAGQYHLIASVLSTSDPSSVLLSTVHWALMVYEHICALRPSGTWKSVVSTHAEFSLEVVSPASRMGSRVIWTFSLDDVIVISRTTEEWNVNVSLTIAGHYKVTVKAFNPISWASFCTHILVQDPVGELFLNVPSVITTHQKHSVLFSVTAGSNVTVSLLVNATLLHKNSSYTTGEEATVVLLFDHNGTVVVELRAENRVSSQNKSLRVCIDRNRKPSPQVRDNPTWQPPTSQSLVHSLADNVWIYAEKQAYPTNTDITFLAVAEVLDPVEFLWHFGDSRSARTTSRTVTKRYHKPGRYDVVVVMSSGRTSVSSDVFPLVVQRAVKLNRLLHQASVLQNQTVMVSCRVNVGTDVTFLWGFGDGSSRPGQSTEQHIFHRTGEFRVKVTASNLVSSASLSSHIFVVDRPCQPPPVKNMGPLRLQVRRYEVIHLGVTYETEVDCDISGDLDYTWTLFDSAGRVFPLPLIDTHRQSLVLPSHLLHYDTYTAIARVQVVGSVVYSNYSVRVQVIPSPPVAFIQDGTNVFINSKNMTVVTLDGQRSFDPDFPVNPVSFSWTCKPVSSITSSCFHHDVPTSSPVLVFPASFLKHNFDQFQFTLTIHSGERSASSETFLTLTSNMIGKVPVYCPQCQGDQVNWDQSFSVTALCEGCGIAPKYIQYTWSLYLVNASFKPVIEVPFCYTLDLSAPSTILEGPATSPQTPSTLHLPATDASQYTPAVNTSLIEDAPETRAKKLYLNMTDSVTLSKNNRKKSTMAGLTEPEPSTFSSLVNLRTAGSGEEPFYYPLGEFDPPEPLYSSTEYQPLALDNSGVLYPDHFGQRDVISEFPIDSDSSADWDFSFPVLESGDLGGRLDSDYDVHLMSAEEGDPGISAGRPSGVDGESFSPGDDSVFHPAVHEDEGSNLVDSRPSVMIQEPILLDLSRDPVDRDLFESYTYTGISSPLLSFRPFSLRPGSRYMLEVTAKFHDSILGRTQLFLKTNPAPKGMTCQVQPIKGMELYTQFSIFCTSGKEDLQYEYSVSVGDRPPRMLYQGRDFQYYFSLPSGDPNDDYKVTIYTEIRSSTYGTTTKPCPVTVRVQPSFFRDTSSSSSSSSSSSHLDPDLELSESGLRNLSALVRLGNSVEIRNYISLLFSILNRLSLDPEANTHAQRRIRNVLICTACELESSEQASMVDNIFILKNLLQVTSQVTVASARRVTVHVQAISEQFLDSSTPVWNSLDQKTLNTLVALLAYSLQAAVTSYDFTPEMFNSADIKQALESDSHGGNIRNAIAPSNGCIPDSSSGVYIKKGGSISPTQTMQLVADILQTASDLMLKHILFHEAHEHRVSTGLIALYATYQNQTSTVISSGSTAFYMPASLIQLLFVHRSRETESRPHRPCVLSMLTELSRSPYTWARYPGRLSGPVVYLSLYECSTRRKIPVRSLIQPMNIELQQPPRNKSSVREYVLLRSQVNYHSFKITQEHLQQAIQLSVAFMPPLNKAFPVMLLFRMFERPTPSMHHLHRIHHWESSTTRFTLAPPYLSAAGVGHLALLNADFGKAPRHKDLSEQVSYSLTVDSSLCLSWDGHQGAWTHHGCRTQQADSTTAVNCSCHQLRPLTVVQQQIQSSHDTTDLEPFLSVSSDLRVLCVLVLCVCLYIVGLVVCKRADVVSEVNRRVHYLSDNSPCDPYLYAVTIHTGLCSAACMSAKVYIVLNGEDGFSQTRELQVPGCTLFRRNSQDTFIFSAADSLGPVWGVHIWHDNSGPSPNWYLKQVEVSEVNRGHVKGRAWLFVAQCWLAVNKGDGRVERMLRVCTQGIGFAKMFCLKLSDYLANHHIWISVHSCPCPNSFTHTQRLSVSLLLLLGYSCVNTVILSQMDAQLPFELGIIDVSAVSVTTGVLSVVAVLPAAAIISFLFRLREVKPTGSGVQHTKGRKTENDFFEVTDSIYEPHLSWSSLQQWAQEAWRKKYQATDLLPASTTILENKNTDKQPVIQTDVFIRKQDALALENNMGPALQNVLLVTEGNNVDQAPQGKEFDLLSESSGFHGTEKALLFGTRDGGQATQKGEDPQGKMKEGSHHQAAWSGHSRCYHVVDRLKGRGFRPVSQWCHYLAWTLCLLLSLSCLVLSAVLGMRFSSSKVLLWIHSLFFSLMCCIFLIQPAVIITVAVAVSLWYRKRADFHNFSSIREFEIETSKLQRHNGANQPEDQFGTSAFPQERCSYLEKLLGARQRARYLRLVRPPTPAELRKSRGKKRRETLIHNTLRDLSVCGSMLFLMLCINYGSSFTDHYRLNKAVRKQFIRGHDNAFMSIQKQEDWWKWAQTSLLNVLYKNISATTEFDVIQQSHVLFGEPILWQTKVSSSFQGQVSGVTLVPECLRLFLSGSRTSTYPQSNALVPMTPPGTCGQLGCYSGPSATVGLGHTKSDAASKLKLLHSGGWLGRQTVAVKVQFTLFSPAPNLFTGVTVLAEQSPTGVLLPSAQVQSVRVYHTLSVWDYVVMVCQLLFLLLSLLQLCDQVYTVGQQGLMGYWRTPCNWLEVSLLTVTLVYYIYYIYQSIIILEVVELLQRHNYRGHVDVSLLATWEQCIRTLRGVTLFLLTMKCATVLRVNRTMATSATLLTHSLSSLFWPMISGLILMGALSCVGSLLFAQSSWALSSLSRSLQTLLCHRWGLRAVRGLLPGPDFLYGGVLYLSSTVVWTAVVHAIGVVSSLVRSAKRSQSRGNVFTIAELAGYIRQRVSGRRRQAWIENHVEGKNYYFEEFESLVDELLFRLNALSNSLHHTLPPKAHRYREEGSPVTSPIQEPSNMDTQDFVKTQMTEETMVGDHTDVSGHGETLPASHQLRSKLELEILHFLQQRGLRRENSSSDVLVASDNSEQPGTRAEENPKDRALQTYLKAQNCLSLPESASLIRVWTEDVLEKQVDDRSETKHSCWLSQTQATHAVVVEVLVHEEPGSVEPDKH